MRFMFILMTCLGIASCSSKSPSSSNQKPEGIVAPVGVLGVVSDIRKKILQNTLNEAVSEQFRVVPQERFEQAQEQAFLELEYDQCTEDQCIMLIQEFLQVEHVFQLEVVSEGPIVQLSLKLVTLDEKKTKTEFCERCSTIELSNRVRMLTAKILSEVDISGTEAFLKKPKPEKIEPEPKLKKEPKKVEPIKKERKKDAGIKGQKDQSLTGEKIKELVKKESAKKEVVRRISSKTKEDLEKSDIGIRALVGMTSSSKTTVSTNSIFLSWNQYGLGSSNISYKTTTSGITHQYSGTSLDLSYSFGDELSYSFGGGFLLSGNGTISSSSGNYKTSEASGTSYHALIGMDFYGIEGLVGYKSIKLDFKGFKNSSDGSSLNSAASISGGLLIFGVGVHF